MKLNVSIDTQKIFWNSKQVMYSIRFAFSHGWVEVVDKVLAFGIFWNGFSKSTTKLWEAVLWFFFSVLLWLPTFIILTFAAFFDSLPLTAKQQRDSCFEAPFWKRILLTRLLFETERKQGTEVINLAYFGTAHFNTTFDRSRSTVAPKWMVFGAWEVRRLNQAL